MFETFYGLSGKPFQLTPDPEFYFRSLTHRKALSYLGYGLNQGEGFIVITGEVGAGKSTLVAHLVDTIDQEQVTLAQVVTSKLGGDEIVHVVAQAFGLDIEGHDKASALGRIESLLHAEARAGRRCLLIVDEAQNLALPALEELRMLSNFQLGNHPLLQTLLLGQPEFRKTIQTHPGLEQLRQRVIAAHHLDAMQTTEIEPYVTWRLKKVGWTGKPSFGEGVFKALYDASGGVPRRVNQIANRLLLLGAVEEREHIDVAMLQSVMAELHEERSFHDDEDEVAEVAAPAGFADAEIARPQPEPASAPAPQADIAADMAQIDRMLAARDAQIAELQQAVVELSQASEDTAAQSVQPALAALEETVVRLEARAAEQEREVRRTLEMLIDWVESEIAESKAA